MRGALRQAKSMYDKVMFKLLVIDLLKLLKSNYSLYELSRMIDEPPSVISRYVNGRILPSDDKAEAMYRRLREIADIPELVRMKLTIDKNGFLNNQSLIGDISVLRVAASAFVDKYRGRVDKVLSPATDGVPFATIMAELLNVPLVIAKTRREVGVKKFLEISFTTEDGAVMTYYVDRSLIRSRDRILIVDDVIRTGRTHRSLIEMVRRAGATVVGIVVLIVIGDRWKKELKGENIDYILPIVGGG
ncbi:hypothetical protein B6U99_02450 [Candidatus Geothermarchaeota archaeon ex4572_27]|nr:MAG: hypothetical protein B6U99_02450 [Candidatus Geothermarchaeota archaeon ex4572_27]